MIRYLKDDVVPMTSDATGFWFDGQFPQDASTVILHPNFVRQHLLLPAILGQRDRTPIFLSLQQPGTTLESLWNLLSEALGEQTKVSLPAYDSSSSPAKAAQALLKALKAVEDYVLMLENYDLVDGASVTPFVVALVKNLPANCQLVLGGRTLPSELMEGQSTSSKVTLFPINGDRMLVDYTNRSPDRVILEVFGLGAGRAYINGKLVDRWDGTLPRSLFFYFVDRGMVTRDEIFKTFWPDLSVREATNVFHVTKRKISEILGFDLTTYWSGFYRISPAVDLHYDVVKFGEDLQNSAVVNDDEASILLGRAIDLYRGAFLSSVEMEWAKARREELRLMYAEGLSALAKIREQQDELPSALGLYLRSAGTLPQREDTARAIMTLYSRLGEPRKALEVYARLVDELKYNLAVSPDPRTVELAEKIRGKK